MNFLENLLSEDREKEMTDDSFLGYDKISHLILKEFKSSVDDKDFSESFLTKPYLRWIDFGNKSLKVLTFYPFRKHASKFLMDMLTNYLLPKRYLKISRCYFCNHETEKQELTVCEIVLEFESLWEKDLAIMNLELKQQEICLGLSSAYKAQKILEMQWEAHQEKLARVQEILNYLIERFPLSIDYDVFTLMQQIFLDVKQSFKMVREPKQLVKLVVALYFLQKELVKACELDPKKRHLFLSIKHAKIHQPLGIKSVLGISVCFNFLQENENFSKKQYFRAISSVVRGVEYVEDSYLEVEVEEGIGKGCYIEISKTSNIAFSLDEIKKLKNRLTSHLIGGIEHLQRPVFMPRNEEEVMKNIVLLSGQLKYVKDIPQVIISFDEQTYSSLTFTVILVRLLQDGCQNAKILLKMIKSGFQVVLERERMLGKIRHKYSKEALVMRMSLEAKGFLREDDSIDLYKARQSILKELEKVFGRVRDFNGGMISKQVEAFIKLRKALGTKASENRFLLENFFHSIYPIEMRSVISTKPLSKLFTLLLDRIKRGSVESKTCVKAQIEGNGFDVFLIEFNDLGLKQKVVDQMASLQIMSRKLIQLHLTTLDRTFLGYIYFYGEKVSKRAFQDALYRALDI